MWRSREGEEGKGWSGSDQWGGAELRHCERRKRESQSESENEQTTTNIRTLCKKAASSAGVMKSGI